MAPSTRMMENSLAKLQEIINYVELAYLWTSFGGFVNERLKIFYFLHEEIYDFFFENSIF